MQYKVIALLAGLLGLAASSLAQNELAGRNQYPHFRVLSGMPGGGFGMLPSGRPDFSGAFALATPIGYTLGGGSYALCFFNTGEGYNPFAVSVGSRVSRSNGTISGMAGTTFLGFNLTVGSSILSSRGDNVLNLQISPHLRGKIGVAVGVQDTFSTGGASGEPLDQDEGGLSRSYYVVATYDAGNGTYLTFGKGERRYQGVFGSVSTTISPRLKAMIEFDGFNLNGGFLYSLSTPSSPLGKRRVHVEAFLGLIRGKYASAGLSLSF